MRTSSVELVAHVGKQRQLPLGEELGHLLDQPRLRQPVGDLGDDDVPGAAAALLLGPARPHPERAASGAVGLGDRRLRLDDDAAGREIGPGHEVEELLGRRLRMRDQVERRVAELGGVVRRDRRRHADRDPLRAVGEEVREGRREHDRLLLLAVVVRAEIDRVLLDAFEEEPRDLGHARFGVALGGRVVAVDVAEIALPVDERVALREILRHAHERVVDGLVAVRVVLADDVADDAGAFLVAVAGIEAQQPHRVQDAAVDGLQAVAGVRQRPVHDGREGIGEIALLERLLQVDRLDALAGGRVDRLAHERDLVVRESAAAQLPEAIKDER